ncbi:MAG: hypothetical protein [Wendovervirus sonii]|uniref:DUF4062 domain-containing protein n=1 Tax=phage Lak_Megaphage_Sonny TaxID=3109229 RepID=A0ABZ0Z3F7_9CAUD|nr:MAG: hypothetical protein [phage Lak_Megaphage_Sonny]
MKTIIVTSTDEESRKMYDTVHKIEKYTDKQIKDAVICTRYCDRSNYSIVCAEMKEATKINDFDLFLVGIPYGFCEVETLKTINKARTLTIEDTDIDSARNYILMQ